MAPRGRYIDFFSVGSLERVGSSARARVRWTADGVEHKVVGPLRNVIVDAEEDLAVMRASAHGMQGDIGYEAIAKTATRLRDEAARLRNRGSVEDRDGSARAAIEWNDNGVRRRLHGPWRNFRQRAEEDLENLWRAGSRELREFSFDAMRQEASRMFREAEYESRVGLVGHSLQAALSSKPPTESSDDEEEDWDDEDPYILDNDELPWEAKGLENYSVPPPSPVTCDLPEPKDADEATALLARFRPTRNCPTTLRRLLECRANPDIITPQRQYCPLENVMSFASIAHVNDMRNLLLEFGAQNTPAMQARWKIRQRADACEEAWMRNFHRDPR